MKAKLAVLLTVSLALVALLLPAALTGAGTQPQTVSPPAAGGQPQHIALGGGRYLAVVPAALGPDTTARQGPAVDT